MTTPKGRSINSVALQFRFSHVSDIPLSIRQFRQQPTKKDAAVPHGELIINPTKGTSAIQLLLDLERGGFILFDASYEERGGSQDRHYMTRFTFVRESPLKPPPQFMQVKSAVTRALFKICNEALWETCAYLNPVTDTAGQVLQGKFWTSIIFRCRQPFLQGDGQRVTIWQKDAAGDRVGDEPLPLSPSFYLCASRQGGFIAVPA